MLAAAKATLKTVRRKSLPQSCVFSNVIQSDAGSKMVRDISGTKLNTHAAGVIIRATFVTKQHGAGV
jgi:hypothetical protein